jgi:DTW domain-containing protein
MNTLIEHRELCAKCRRAAVNCYCTLMKPFASGAEFVILIHPRENRKRIGTGRITHRCLTNSQLIEGVDFTANEKVNQILRDEKYWPAILYPGREAFDLSKEGVARLESTVPVHQKLLIFVIDGTWYYARKMLKVSRNLWNLPQIRFEPTHRSNYQIRKQPHDICFSTLEAVHFMIDRLNTSSRWNSGGDHETLLEVFRFMITRQLSHVRRPRQKAVRGDRQPGQKAQGVAENS